MNISRSVIDQIVDEARSAAQADSETGGVIAGSSPSTIDRAVAITYQSWLAGIDLPEADIETAQILAQQGGRQLVGFYHSHLDAMASPSEADRAAMRVGEHHLIVGLLGSEPDLGLWTLAGDHTHPLAVELDIVD